jgi:hypothetical protein
LNCQPFVFVWFFCTVPSPIAEFVSSSTKPFLMFSDHQWLLVPIMATRVLCPEQKRYPTVWENVVFPILQSEKGSTTLVRLLLFITILYIVRWMVASKVGATYTYMPIQDAPLQNIMYCRVFSLSLRKKECLFSC